MKIFKPEQLGLLLRSFLLADQHYLSVAACASFPLDLQDPNRLLAEQDMWPVIEAALGPDEIFDFGIPKARGEYLVYGSAFATKPAPGLEVSVRVGAMAKTLAIFGNRHWGLVGPESPVPFARMAVSYVNAFGGPDFPENPVGKGAVPDATGKKPLPNIQDPRRVVISPQDRPPPAGFSAYPQDWPQRRRYLGKLDERWLREDWPHFPRDTDWEFFNTAPEDQRLPGFFTGDEKIEITAMHPAKAVLSSFLPGLRPRLFVHQREGDQEAFREVPCRAETLWLFPDREIGILLYRGTVAVADEEYEDVLHLYGRWESRQEGPRPIAEYAGMFQAELMPPAPVPDVAPPPAPLPAAAPAPPEPPALHPELADLARESDQLEAQATAMLRKAGLDPETAVKRFLPAEERAAASSLAELGLAVAALERQTAEFMKKFNISAADVEKILAPQPEAPVKSAAEIIVELRQAGIQNPELESRLQEAERLNRAAAADLEELEKKRIPRAAFPESPPAPVLSAGQTLTVAEVMARHDRRESLSGLKLAGLDFTGRNLAGADFTGTDLTGAIFAQAALTGTIFKESILKDANFQAADLVGANLERIDATGGIFREARLPGAKMGGGDFSGADFTDADMSGADAAGTTFEAAVMVRMKARGISAPQSLFAGANLCDADLRDGELSDADFTGAQLSYCTFFKAHATGIRLNGATGDHVKFGLARLTASRADADTVLTDTRFFEADLADACWEGARIKRAQLIEAHMERADFSRCDLTGAIMILAVAREAKFMKADLTNANLTGINLFKGSLRKAVLSRTELKLSNLYGVDFYQAKMMQTNIEGSNIERTLLKLRRKL